MSNVSPIHSDERIGASAAGQVAIAKLLGVGTSTVVRGRKVIVHGVPELIAGVAAHEFSISAAAELATLPAEEQREVLAGGPKVVAHTAETMRTAARRTPPPPRDPSKPDRTRAGTAARLDRMRALAAEGHSSRQIAAVVGVGVESVRNMLKRAGVVVSGDRATSGLHHHDANRIVSTMVLDAEHLTADVKLINFAALDTAQVPEWLISLRESHRALGRFISKLEREGSAHGESDRRETTSGQVRV